MTHTCDALVVTCIDFRFQKNLENWIHEHAGKGEYDRVAWAGGVFDAESIKNQLSISVRLHQINKVVFINHEDCGAYGAAGTPERQQLDLKKMRESVKATYPGLEVELYIAKLDGGMEKVE